MKYLVLTIILLCNLLEGNDVGEVLKTIPSRDKKKIEILFSYLIQRDSLGYVLLGGTKPAAFCSIPIVCSYEIVPHTITKKPLKYQKNLKQGWDIWERYEPRFKHPNIIICREYDFLGQSSFIQVFFIDKRKLEVVLEKHKSDFIEILGKNFSSDNFIAQLEAKKKLRPLIKNDEKLLGIILGFGKESSAAFKESIQNKEIDSSLPIIGFKPEACSITPVSFRGNPNSSEVQILLDKYSQELLEIQKVHDSDQFLKITLEALCSS